MDLDEEALGGGAATAVLPAGGGSEAAGGKPNAGSVPAVGPVGGGDPCRAPRTGLAPHRPVALPASGISVGKGLMDRSCSPLAAAVDAP